MLFFRSIAAIALALLWQAATGQSTYGYIENKGQWPQHVVAAKTAGAAQLFLQQDGLRIKMRNHEAITANHQKGKMYEPGEARIKGHVYEMRFVGANVSPQVQKSQEGACLYNYFLDADPSQWAPACRSYSEIQLLDVYSGIDFKLYQQDGMTKYDFLVDARADVHSIRLSYKGMDKISIEHGRIRIDLGANQVFEQAPIAWQIINGIKQYVTCSYELTGSEIRFRLGNNYNADYSLIIDPQLVFSTYSGSESDNFGYSATYDEDGNLYSGSSAFGQGYPTTLGAFQIDHAGGDSAIGDGIDMALSKYSSDGTTMLWSTFVGGAGDDLPHSLIVNSNNELYVYGTTGSDDFPISALAYQDQFLGGTAISPVGTGATFPNGTDIVVVHLNASGSNLIGSTYLGGGANDGINSAVLLKRNYADEFRGEISLDENEEPIIVSSTFSTNFPIVGGFQTTSNGGQEAVLARLNTTLSNLEWSSYLGGSGDDSGFSIVEQNDGSIYVTGGTTSTDFETTSAAHQTNHAGVVDGYIVRVAPNGSSLLSSTFYGASNFDQIYFVELDDQGAVYGYGQSISPGNSLISNVGYSQSNSGLLLCKFNADLADLIWSTTIGTGDANPNLSPSAFLVDYCQRIYISGWGVSTSNSALNPGTHLFPMINMEVTSDAAFPTSTTGDFYMAVFDENMTTLEYATFFGGNTSSEHVDGGTSRFDRKGVIYQSVCAGCGSNDDFPIAPADAWSSTNNSTNCNNGVFKFDFQLPLTVADFEAASGCANEPVSFTSNSTYAQNYMWNFGDDTGSNLPNPNHVYTAGGTYEVQLIVTHPLTCNLADTMIQFIEILAPNRAFLPEVNVCANEASIIGPEFPLQDATYTWIPADYLSSNNQAQPQFTAGESTVYTVLVDNGQCIDTLVQSVDVVAPTLVLSNDTVLCAPALLNFDALFTPTNSQLIWSDNINFTTMLNDSPFDSDIAVFIESPTVFYVQSTFEACSLVDSIMIDLIDFQTLIEGDFIVCADASTTLSILDPNPLFQYTWSPANLLLSGQNTPTVEVVVPTGTLFTVVSSYNDCTASDNVFVDVSPLSAIGADATATPQVIVAGQTIVLQGQPNGYGYNWSPSSTVDNDQAQNTSAQPLATTTYYLTVSDGECLSTDSVTVRVVEFVCGPPSIYVPNAFTPNVDGVNEKLYVRANNIDALYFVIYDRWGEKMFETQSLLSGWDGLYEGRVLPPDVYTYYLEATCAGGSTYFEKGNITLIR